MRYCIKCKNPMYTSIHSIWIKGKNYDCHKSCNNLLINTKSKSQVENKGTNMDTNCPNSHVSSRNKKSTNVDNPDIFIVKEPMTIEEAIYNLREFFEADMWYACHSEWKTEEEMLKYLDIHFTILENEIKELLK